MMSCSDMILDNITIKCNQQMIRAVRFNVDGSYCLTCGSDRKIKLWNPYKKILLKTYGGHADQVLDVCASCESNHIVSASSDKSVILWDVATGQPVRRYRSHAGPVTCVKYNEESTVAISGSLDNTVMFWDTNSRKLDPVLVLKDAKDCITSIQVTDSQFLISSVDGFVRLYDIRMGKLTTDFIGHIITYANITRDGQCYILSCNDNTIKLFDKDSGEILSTYSGHESKDLLLENAVNCKDTQIISGSATGEIFYWDLISGSCIKKNKHTNRPVVSLSHHPTKNILVSASEDQIKLWNDEPTDIAQ